MFTPRKEVQKTINKQYKKQNKMKRDNYFTFSGYKKVVREMIDEYKKTGKLPNEFKTDKTK